MCKCNILDPPSPKRSVFGGFLGAQISDPTGGFLDGESCWKCASLSIEKAGHSFVLGSKSLNSHYFHIIGDGHQPNSRGLYTHMEPK